jgi:hypothetical protein
VTDLVRIEVETALRRDIPVVPVLVGNATMPQPADLPDGLQDFAFRHAVKVDALEDFDDHVRRLIRSLDRLLKTEMSPAQQEAAPPKVPTAISEKATERATDSLRLPTTLSEPVTVAQVKQKAGLVIQTASDGTLDKQHAETRQPEIWAPSLLIVGVSVWVAMIIGVYVLGHFQRMW